MEHEQSSSCSESAIKCSRRKSLRFNRGNEELDDSVLVALDVFTNRGWDIFQSSPLFGFKGTDVHLKKYSLILRNYCALMDVDEDVEYIVKFNYLDNFDTSGKYGIMRVEVQCRKESDGKDIPLYLGFFMSWGDRRLSTEFLFLPLLVCKAKTIKVKRLIHSSLQKMFDCVIKPYILQDIQLMWLNSLFISISKDARDERRNVLTLTLLPTWTDEHKLTLYISLCNLKKIWTSIRSKEDTIFVEETRSLYDGILKSISQELAIDLCGFRIYEIKYPDATVQCRGKFSVKNVETVNQLFIFLYNELRVNFVNGKYLEDTVEEPLNAA